MIFISSKISDGNMSLHKDNPEKVLQNRKKIFKRLGINLNKVAEVKQVHGNQIISVDRTPSPLTKADGLITNKQGLYLIVKVADCIPIGFYDPKHNAIGLIHIGFRGLEKGIIKKAIKLMKEEFHTNSKDLIVKFGPSIGPCHYRIDLWGQAENQLIGCGVLKENIENPKICTYESKDYFSHRRAEDKGEDDFRFVTILGLKG